MTPKRIFMIGTIAIAITLGSGLFGKETDADIVLFPSEPAAAGSTAEAPSPEAETEAFLETLGAPDEQSVYDALYEGISLAELAERNDKPIEPLLQLQIEQLKAQLDNRLSAGSITPRIYQAQLAELPEIVRLSAYGEKGL
ncbi:hypothetical protein [Paenibacillus koleovorans]|uniref:hypothetical protein n=1 Tax=Paenibacillus koleovorans TaxID=121608 RepID=UPI000FDA9F41|nr:hypothetical protein [Paenibacillus koleovorans]